MSWNTITGLMSDIFRRMKLSRTNQYVTISTVSFFTDVAVGLNFTFLVFSSVGLRFILDTQGTSESNYPFDAVSMKDLHEIFQQIKRLS